MEAAIRNSSQWRVERRAQTRNRARVRRFGFSLKITTQDAASSAILPPPLPFGFIPYPPVRGADQAT